MALTHVRNIEAFAFLVPLVLAKPLAGRWKLTQATVGGEIRSAPYVTVFASLTIVAAAWTSTSVYVTHHHFAFTATQTPAAAVELLEQRQVQRIFNSYQFGGYLIARDIKPFIDGRAELYGEKFVMNFFHAVEGRKVDDLLRMLEDFRIEATLLAANSPAAQVLNHVQGWKRLYADEIAVVHVRTDQPLPNAVRAPEASR